MQRSPGTKTDTTVSTEAGPRTTIRATVSRKNRSASSPLRASRDPKPLHCGPEADRLTLANRFSYSLAPAPAPFGQAEALEHRMAAKLRGRETQDTDVSSESEGTAMTSERKRLGGAVYF